MRRDQTKKCDAQANDQNRPPRHVSGQMRAVASDTDEDGESTDPLASEAPLLRQSEWPSSDELESALLEADPFESVDGSNSLTGEIAELFGEIEPRLPRDTLPSPPPSPDEPLRFDLRRNRS